MCVSLVSINKTFLKIKATSHLTLFLSELFFLQTIVLSQIIFLFLPQQQNFYCNTMSDTQQHTANDRFLVIALKQDDQQAFTRIFHAYYKDLVLFGGTYIRKNRFVEDIVQKYLSQIMERPEDTGNRTPH